MGQGRVGDMSIATICAKVITCFDLAQSFDFVQNIFLPQDHQAAAVQTNKLRPGKISYLIGNLPIDSRFVTETTVLNLQDICPICACQVPACDLYFSGPVINGMMSILFACASSNVEVLQSF